LFRLVIARKPLGSMHNAHVQMAIKIKSGSMHNAHVQMAIKIKSVHTIPSSRLLITSKVCVNLRKLRRVIEDLLYSSRL
jgi:hypothetical protein